MANFGLLEYSLIAAGLLIVIGLVFLVLMMIKNKIFIRWSLVRYFYPEVRKTAVLYDYYLINTFELSITDTDIIKVDHLLFGNKYIYLINDYYDEGVIQGKRQDKKWIMKTKDGKEKVLNNPLDANRELIRKICLKTTLDSATFIGITLVNNKTNILELQVNSHDEFIIDLRDFRKLISKIESRPIQELNKAQLQERVLEFDHLNLRRKRKQQWKK